MESSSSSYRRITAIYQSRIGSSSKGSSSEKVSRSFSLFNLNGGSSGGVWEEGGDERSSEPPAVLEVVQECVDIMKEHVDVLDKLSKSFAPVLFNKLKEEQLAVVLFRLSSNHRSLFEKIVPSSDATETMDNASQLQNRFFENLEILSSNQFRTSYIDFAKNSSQLRTMFTWVSESSSSLSNPNGVILRRKSVKDSIKANLSSFVSTAYGKRQSLNLSDDIDSVVMYLNHILESLEVLSTSCKYFEKLIEDKKVQKSILSIKEITNSDVWKNQQNPLQKKYFMCLERQLREVGHLDAGSVSREIIRDGCLFKASKLFSRLVLTRLILFDDIIMWIDENSKDFFGFLMISGNVEIVKVRRSRHDFLIRFNDPSSSSKPRLIKFSCKTSYSRSIWMYQIRKVIREKSSGISRRPTIQMNEQSRKFFESIDLKELILVERIGQGTFGEVFRAVNRKDPDRVIAVKVLHVHDIKHEESILREIEIHKSCDNPSILKCYGFAGPDTLNRVWIFMPFAEIGSLVFAREISKLDYSESQIAYVCACIVKALAYLHERGIVHRDVKSKNILLSKDCKVFLSDFGVSASCDDLLKLENFNEDDWDLNLVGTPHFIAPEMLQKGSVLAASYKSDIWSLGITAIELWTGDPPNSTLSPFDVIKATVSNPSPVSNMAGLEEISNDFRNFLSQCLEKEVERRASAWDLLSHPFIKCINVEEDGSILQNVVDRFLLEQERVQSHSTINRPSPSSSGCDSLFVSTNDQVLLSSDDLCIVDYEN